MYSGLVMIIKREPLFRIWVPGYPKSSQADRQNLERYKEGIRIAATKVVTKPTKSRRLDVEIFFQAESLLRPDVDNIIKPILDALTGVLYEDDSQARSVKITALPSLEEGAYGMSECVNIDVLNRLMKHPPKEFLINIYEGSVIHGGP